MHDSDAGRVHVRICLHLEEQRQSIRSVIDAEKLGPVPEDSDLRRELRITNNLASLQIRSRGSHATDPRDHVFALLGIAQGHGGHAPAVDYSLSLAEVYARTAYAWYKMSTRRPLEWLMCINGSYHTSDLPSWVPDWRRPWNGKPLMHHSVETGDGTLDGRDSRCKIEFPDLKTPLTMPIQLSIRGIQILQIKDVERVKREDWDVGRHAELINSFPAPYPTTYITYKDAFVRTVMLKNPIYDAKEVIDPQESFWEYCRAPRGLPRLRPIFRGEISKFPPNICLSMRFHLGETEPTPHIRNSGAVRSADEPRYTQTELYSSITPHYRTLVTFPQDEFVRSRTWFITQNGFMGLAPDIVQPGDAIAHLFGGDFPCVIRKRRVENGKTIWGLIGRCFVLGLMESNLDYLLPEADIEDFIFE
ncbi:hypothetical protein B0J13DRAFT_638883 [Dactylonectria estremocensis]|uniref:Heterokaryon incompatibility domain-containing protein n=1 Tax=Dactylonectria estremocensis TaxID=1079267 RepID=A0A9P9J1H5_9HYPO|nr:hypothetical protein B0J13DRAFT_638883 [Dactylonectria estremocensis]